MDEITLLQRNKGLPVYREIFKVAPEKVATKTSEHLLDINESFNALHLVSKFLVFSISQIQKFAINNTFVSRIELISSTVLGHINQTNAGKNY
jgi:hypothetical protein